MCGRLQAGKPSRYVTSHPGQLSLAIPPWVGAMSTSESWDVNRHTARCTSPVSVVWQCKLVSGWGLRKRTSAPLCGPYGSRWTLRFLRLLLLLLLLLINSNPANNSLWKKHRPYTGCGHHRSCFFHLPTDCVTQLYPSSTVLLSVNKIVRFYCPTQNTFYSRQQSANFFDISQHSDC